MEQSNQSKTAAEHTFWGSILSFLIAANIVTGCYAAKAVDMLLSSGSEPGLGSIEYIAEKTTIIKILDLVSCKADAENGSPCQIAEILAEKLLFPGIYAGPKIGALIQKFPILNPKKPANG